MPIIAKSWLGFIKHSLGIYSSAKPEEEIVLSRAFKLFLTQVVESKLPLSSAIALLSDPRVFKDLMKIAHADVKRHKSDSETDDLKHDHFTSEDSERLKDVQFKTSSAVKSVSIVADGVLVITDDLHAVKEMASIIQDQNKKLVQENAELHAKLDAAKKRAIRYFRTSLFISASSVAFAIGMRYGAVDFVKNEVVDLFHNKVFSQQDNTTSSSNNASSETVYMNPIILKVGTNGLREPREECLYNLIDAGHEIVNPTINRQATVCLRPNQQILINPESIQQQLH